MKRLLIDLSAWARTGNDAVADRWAELLAGDMVLCHPVFAIELLHTAINAADYRALRRDLDDALDWVWPDAETAMIAVAMQQRMALERPTGQRVKTADLLIAALASQHGLGVLHYDTDFDVIRDRGGVPFDSEWIAPRGTIESPQSRVVKERTAFRRGFGERMVQLQGTDDLEVWPELIAWVDGQLLQRGFDLPPPVL